MGEFSKGWRRKAGLATLAMALVLMMGWMRSYITRDSFAGSVGGTLHEIHSAKGTVHWHLSGWNSAYPFPCDWEVIPLPALSLIHI